MKCGFVWIGLLLLAACSATGGHSRLDIVGGEETRDYPAVMGFIAYTPGDPTESICTATLVRPDVLITAAHCVDPRIVGKNAQFELYTGYDLYTKGAWGKKLVPRKVVFDAKFNRENLAAGHDLAFIFLDEKLSVTPLPLLDHALSLSGPLQIIGYGQVASREALSSGTKRLLKTTILRTTAHILEAGSRGHGTCVGDSGGPALMTVEGVLTVIGVVSFGNTDCSGESSISLISDDLDYINLQLAE